MIRKLKIIAAVGENYELGIKEANAMPWNLPGDLAFFRKQTLNSTIVMGRTTFESIGKPLPKRRNVVITTDENWSYEDVEVYNSISKLLENVSTFEGDVYIIGGASIYNQFINEVDEIVLTKIKESFSKADIFFPTFDENEYEHEILGKEDENGISYTFNRYSKK